MSETATLNTIDTTSQRMSNLIITAAGISLIATLGSGFWMIAASIPSLMHTLHIVHLCAGLCLIFFGSLHIYTKRRWFYKLLMVSDLDWASRAECRLIPIYTLLFAAVSISAILIMCGIDTLIDFHRGCAFLFSIFAVVHVAVNLKSLVNLGKRNTILS